MKIDKISNINELDIMSILEVWESSVRATHDFLSEKDIMLLKPQVVDGVKYLSELLCVRDNEGIIKAFVGVYNKKIEMLFITNDYRGKGFGRKLIEYAIEVLNAEYVDVNEQNTQGVDFYSHVGFKTFKRSEFDEQGNPFPILHMKLK